MPPKKGEKKGGKKKKKANKDAGEIVLPEDQIRFLQSQAQALELQLVCRSEDTADALAEREKLRIELAEANKRHDNERQMAADITKTMTRQYKGMQEQLLQKVVDRERIIQTLRDEIEAQKAAATAQIVAKESIIQQKDEEFAKCRQEIEDLCKHFANLLEDATTKISTHLVT